MEQVEKNGPNRAAWVYDNFIYKITRRDREKNKIYFSCKTTACGGKSKLSKRIKPLVFYLEKVIGLISHSPKNIITFKITIEIRLKKEQKSKIVKHDIKARDVQFEGLCPHPK